MRKKFRYLIIFIVLVIIFRIVQKSYIFNLLNNVEWKKENIEIRIVRIDSITEDKVIYVGVYDGNNYLVVLKKNEKKYSFGDKIFVLSSCYSISKAGNPYELDYLKYLNSRNIVGRIYVDKILSEKISSNILKTIRNSMDNVIDKNLGKFSPLVKSLMYGEDDYLDDTFKEKCKSIGIGHMMCVSGTHVLYLMMDLENVIKSRKNKYINIIILIYFYLISFFSISLLRVVLMYILSFAFSKLKYYFRLGITLVIILIINPYYIFNIGIIFSFLSVISIRVFNPVILSFINVKMKIINNYISSNIALSISSQILILPFEVYYFGKIYLISVISNLFLGITISFLMKFIFYLFIFLFIPIISNFFSLILYCVCSLFCTQIDILNLLNIFIIHLPKINIVIFILYYLSLFIIMYKSRICIVYFWKYRKKAKVLLDLVIIISLLYCSFWYIYTMYLDEYVIYFNVGQGNMCLVHKGVKNIVIDCGSTQDKNAASILNNYLKAKNIQNLDLVLITHMHADHMNGVGELVDLGVGVSRVGYSKPYTKVYECEKLEQKLKENNIGIMYLMQEDKICINDIAIYIVTPPKDLVIYDSDMLNANSTVYLLENNTKRYLFMGDSTKATEKYILDNYIEKVQNIDYYQVSHHGSKTSSLREFVESINVKNAIISCKEAVYGHPDNEVLDLFLSLNIQTYITEKVGAIIF